MALAALGQAPVTGLNEQNERARRLDLFYEPARREVLRKHDWSFARCAGRLAEVEVPEEENPYPQNRAYAYPTRALYIVKLFTPGRGGQRLEFKEFFSASLNARCLACRHDNVYAEYVQDSTDESKFTPDFCDMLALCLASKTAMTLTGDAQLAQLAYQKYTLALDEARLSNKTEEWETARRRSAFVEAR